MMVITEYGNGDDNHDDCDDAATHHYLVHNQDDHIVVFVMEQIASKIMSTKMVLRNTLLAMLPRK